MNKEDFIRKISSRKFWALISGLVVSILIMTNIEEATITQIVAIIGAFASIITYILGEAHVDGKAVENSKIDKEE